MAKLSKPQARIIGGNKPGAKFFSNPLYNTNQRSIDTLVKHGHLALTDRQPGGFNEYTVQDTPEVRACNAERDAAYAAIMADYDEPAAIAAPVSADAAPAWTPKPGERVRFKRGVQLSGDNRDVDAIQGMGVVGKIVRRCAEVGYEWTVSFGLDGDYNAATEELEPASEPAPDAAQTAAAEMEHFFTMTDAQKFSELINQADVIRKDAEQIAALTRDLADAVAVIREVEDLLMQNGHHTPTVRLADQVNDVFRTLSAVSDTLADVREERDALERELEAVKQMFDGYQAASLDTLDDVQQYRGWIGELIDHLDHISPMEALTRLLSFRRDYQAYTARNEEHTAAMVAALRSRDNGNRVSADNVLAMFADGEDGTIA